MLIENGIAISKRGKHEKREQEKIIREQDRIDRIDKIDRIDRIDKKKKGKGKGRKKKGR